MSSAWTFGLKIVACGEIAGLDEGYKEHMRAWVVMWLVYHGHLVSIQRHDTWQQPDYQAHNHDQVNETGWMMSNNAAFTVTDEL